VFERSHSSAQLILLAALAAFNVLLSFGVVFILDEFSARTILVLLIPVGLHWDIWLASAMSWVRGSSLELEKGRAG
jgi:hypothetical protein